MASVATIVELQAQLTHARDAAAKFLGECKTAAEAEGLSSYDIPPHLAPKAKELSEPFYPPLVRISSLVRQSSMFSSTDVDAINLAVRRIDAALRLRRFEEWGPEILSDEDIVLGVRPAGSSE